MKTAIIFDPEARRLDHTGAESVAEAMQESLRMEGFERVEICRDTREAAALAKDIGKELRGIYVISSNYDNIRTQVDGLRSAAPTVPMYLFSSVKGLKGEPSAGSSQSWNEPDTVYYMYGRSALNAVGLCNNAMPVIVPEWGHRAVDQGIRNALQTEQFLRRCWRDNQKQTAWVMTSDDHAARVMRQGLGLQAFKPENIRRCESLEEMFHPTKIQEWNTAKIQERGASFNFPPTPTVIVGDHRDVATEEGVRAIQEKYRQAFRVLGMNHDMPNFTSPQAYSDYWPTVVQVVDMNLTGSQANLRAGNDAEVSPYVYDDHSGRWTGQDDNTYRAALNPHMIAACMSASWRGVKAEQMYSKTQLHMASPRQSKGIL